MSLGGLMNTTNQKVVVVPKYGDVSLEKYDHDGKHYIKVSLSAREQDSYILEYEDIIVRDATFKFIEPDVLEGIINDRILLGEHPDD